MYLSALPIRGMIRGGARNAIYHRRDRHRQGRYTLGPRAGSAANTRPARGIRPRVPVTRFWLPAPALFAGMAQKANHRNRNEQLPLSRPPVRPSGRRTTIHARGDRGQNRHGSTSRKAAAPREGRGAARVDYAEIGNPALGLAAYGARLADPPWPRADRSLRPISNSGRTRRWLRLQAAFGSLRSLALSAQLLHPGSNGGEVISSAGPVHGVSSHVHRCFDAGDRAGGGRSGRLLTLIDGLAEGSSHGVRCIPGLAGHQVAVTASAGVCSGRAPPMSAVCPAAVAQE